MCYHTMHQLLGTLRKLDVVLSISLLWKKSTTENVNQSWEIRSLYFCFVFSLLKSLLHSTFNVIFFSNQITDYFCKRWRLLRSILLISSVFSYLIVFQWFTFRYLYENRFFFPVDDRNNFFYHCRRGHFNVCSLLYIDVME